MNDRCDSRKTVVFYHSMAGFNATLIFWSYHGSYSGLFPQSYFYGNNGQRNIVRHSGLQNIKPNNISQTQPLYYFYRYYGLRSGNLAQLLKAIESDSLTVDLPIPNADVHSYVNVYQRHMSIYAKFWPDNATEFHSFSSF